MPLCRLTQWLNLKSILKMNNVKVLLFVSIFICIISSCNSSQDEVITYKLDKTDFNDWNSILEITQSTTLESSDTCIITYAAKSLLFEDNIYFWDYKSKSIHCFTKTGYYKHSFGRIGRATDEYVNIKDIWIDKDELTLNILDDRGVVCYGLSDGKFAKRITPASANPNEYQRFAMNGKDSMLCFTDNNNKHSTVLDRPKEQQGIRKGKRFHFVLNPFYTFENNIRVISDYGEFHIDSYSDGKLSKTYKIDLGNNALPDDIRPKTFKEFNIIDNEPKYFKAIYEVHETKDWLYITFIGPKQTYYYAIINKDNGMYAFGKELNIIFIGADSDSFYGLVYPEYLPEKSHVWNIAGFEDKQGTTNPIFVKIKVDKDKLQRSMAN